MTTRSFDFIIVGSGFAGAILAMLIRKAGHSVVLVERNRHPRFAIGESSTPLANLLLEEISAEFDLPGLRSFSKWGTWQSEHPKIACGIKRGFTFYHHRWGEPFPSDPILARERQLLVGASPVDRVADTHWYRPDFDHALVQQAQALGAVYLDETEVESFSQKADGVSVSAQQLGQSFQLQGRFLFDASGPRGFLQRALELPKSDWDFPGTQAIFAHFTGVKPLSASFIASEAPYSPESAAVHHVFDGGWIWALRFNNGITSAGVVAVDEVANRFGFSSREGAWSALLRELPSVQELFGDAQAVTPFFWQPRVAFRTSKVVGEKWALLPSAAGSIDPLLSTGFPLTLLGIQRLGRLLEDFGSRTFTEGLASYERTTLEEWEVSASLVKGLYRRLNDFRAFSELTLLYFAAASYSESARRLKRPELARQFLLSDRPDYVSLLKRFGENGAADTRDIRSYIEPIDVAGLNDRARHPWYPARAADLIQNAAKVRSTALEAEAFFKTLGLDQRTTSNR